MRFLLLAFVSLSLTVPGGCTCTDPRDGGFLGGVCGLTTGAYDRRLAEREAALAQTQARLDMERADQARLEKLKRARQNRLIEVSNRMTSIEGRIRMLDADIRGREIRKESIEREIAAIERDVAAMSVDTARSGTADLAERSRELEERVSAAKTRLARLRELARIYGEGSGGPLVPSP